MDIQDKTKQELINELKELQVAYKHNGLVIAEYEPDKGVRYFFRC